MLGQDTNGLWNVQMFNKISLNGLYECKSMGRENSPGFLHDVKNIKIALLKGTDDFTTLAVPE